MLSGILGVLARLGRMTPFDAVKAPRLHCTPEGEVWLEADRFAPRSLRLLEERGFALKPLGAWSFRAGGLHMALASGDEFHGVAEPRRDGAAAGPRDAAG